jgi:hypothetical protein
MCHVQRIRMLAFTKIWPTHTISIIIIVGTTLYWQWRKTRPGVPLIACVPPAGDIPGREQYALIFKDRSDLRKQWRKTRVATPPAALVVSKHGVKSVPAARDMPRERNALIFKNRQGKDLRKEQPRRQIAVSVCRDWSSELVFWSREREIQRVT